MQINGQPVQSGKLDFLEPQKPETMVGMIKDDGSLFEKKDIDYGARYERNHGSNDNMCFPDVMVTDYEKYDLSGDTMMDFSGGVKINYDSGAQGMNTATTIQWDSDDNGKYNDDGDYTSTITYDENGNMTGVVTTDNQGNFKFGEKYTYDSNGNLTGVEYDQDGDGKADYSQSAMYDDNGNMIAQKDIHGNVSTYTYDDKNRITSSSSSSGNVHISYDDDKKIVTKGVDVDKDGKIDKEIKYDYNGNVIPENNGNNKNNGTGLGDFFSNLFKGILDKN